MLLICCTGGGGGGGELKITLPRGVYAYLVEQPITAPFLLEDHGRQKREERKKAV